MASPYLGQIILCSFNFAPKNYAFCNGQLMPISQNQALFSLLGTTYGGNGITTFALPNLQGSVPISSGNGYILGQAGGAENHAVTIAELPQHTHNAIAAFSAASQASPVGNFPAAQANNPYATSQNTTLSPGSSSAGLSQAHENRQPYLVITFCIALAGIFPSRG